MIGRDIVFFQAEDGIRDLVRSRGLGDVYKRQIYIDTNIMINENFMRSASAQAFFKACALLHIECVIPEIVIDEAKGNYPKKLDELSLIHI